MNTIKKEIYNNRVSLFVSVSTGVVSSVFVIYLMLLITSLVNSGETFTGIMFVFFGSFIALLVSTYISQWQAAKFATNLVYKLRSLLAHKFMVADYEHIEKELGSKVSASLAFDISQISNGLALLPGLSIRIITIVFGLAYLCYQSAALFVVFLVALLLSLSLSFFGSVLMFKKIFVLREHGDEIFDTFRALSDGAKELAIDEGRKQFFFANQVNPCLEEAHSKELNMHKLITLIQTWGASSLFLVIGTVVFYGIYMPNVSLEILTSFVMLSLYLMQPISFILSSITPVVTCKNSLNKLARLKIYNSDDSDATEQHELTSSIKVDESSWSTIELKDVVYKYTDNLGSGFKLGPASIKIKKGEVLILEGGNGAGKSSIIKLLLGLYKADGGGIYVDGKLIDSTNDVGYKGLFSAIFSDYYLFRHILDEQANIVPKFKLEARLKELKLSNKIEINQGEISTTALSQGQRKRLALLLIYARNKEVLVLDEWAADQDPSYRAYFYERIIPELKSMGKTIIMISHDEKYFNIADRVYKVDEGKIMSSSYELPLSKVF
ncbi:cyclic peptide export ABC transporter [Pseudoalteromonas rhizosphaerae]|uniref:Cyclic peptide export ABC transporter n=1 Tax=Pseudoalteromonas rhizosphaerae TaxID=2518973 RepID=A0ABW8L5J5_9GAMM